MSIKLELAKFPFVLCGIDHLTPKVIVRYIKAVNFWAGLSFVACFVGFALSLPYTIATFPAPSSISTVRDLLFMLSFLLVILCNRYRLYNASRVLFVTLAALGVLAGTVLYGPGTSIETLFVPLILFVFMSFHKNEKSILICSLTILFIIFSIAQVCHFMHWSGILPVIPQYTAIVHIYSFLVTFILSILFFREYWDAKLALDAVARRFQLMAERIEDAFWMVTPDFATLIYASPGLEKQLGNKFQSSKGYFTFLLEVVSEDDKNKLQECLITASQQAFELRFSINYSDPQQKKIFWLRGWPVFDEAGHLINFCGITSDVTAETVAQEAIDKHRARIVEASRLSALGEMSAGIAHEINNPLAIINGRVEQLERIIQELPNPPEKALENCNNLKKMVARIARIVKGLLAFARDSARDPFTPQEINSIIDSAIGLCGEFLLNKGIEIAVDDSAGILKVDCREMQLVEVLVNLIANSRDAIKDNDEKWIKIGYAEAMDQINITVEDSGHGIPDEVASQIFNPFFTTKEVGQGTGLGLSVSFGIIQAHHGTLVLDKTSPNTRFVITLPKSRT